MPSVESELSHALQGLPPGATLVVGYSGGLDSTVLLHALVKSGDADGQGRRVRALHVNHGLHEDAGAWQAHCEARCKALGVPFTALSADSKLLEVGMNGLEEKARDERYRLFAENLVEEEVLLLAHHLDDQVETLLMRLARGAGPTGLAAIPRVRSVGDNLLLRPLLSTHRIELGSYAKKHGLDWVEDPSNQDSGYDRNFLRNEIMPGLLSRWPAFTSNAARSVELLAEASELLAEYADCDLKACLGDEIAVLDCRAAAEWSSPRQRNLLRRWLNRLGLTVPGAIQLARLQQLLADTEITDRSRLELRDCVVCRFGPLLVALARGYDGFAGEDTATQWDTAARATMTLPGNGVLCLDSHQGSGMKLPAGPLCVRYRRGGEQFQLPGRPGRALKKTLQESEIAPWLRSRVPLVYADTRLVYVPGLGCAADAQAAAGEPSVRINWQPPRLFAG